MQMFVAIMRLRIYCHHGIFSRLKIRDGKNGYLKDIPRTLEYILQISAEEMNMKGLYLLISELSLKFRVKALI